MGARPHPPLRLSFSIRGLVEESAASQQRGGATGSWGGIKKALHQVVGERLDTLQITLGAARLTVVS